MKERYWPGAGYVPPKCKSPILLFRAAHQHFWRISDRYMAWRERTHAEVTLLEVPGQHFMVLREPAVSIIAENIRRAIQTVVDLDIEQTNELAHQPEGCSV